MSSNYIRVYLITGIFSTYTLFRYMCIFFDRKDVDKRQEFLLYLLYFSITSLLYIGLNNPAVNIISNIVMFFLLTLNYDSTLKARLIAVVSIYMILMTIELIVMLILEYYGIAMSSGNDRALIIGIISIRIVSYIFMLFISNFKMIRNKTEVSTVHWFSIFIIPAGTLILALIIISTNYAEHVTLTLISIVIILVINVLVFYFYNEVMKFYQSKFEKKLLQQQNSAYEKQFEIINRSKENTKRFRHDLKNHALSLKHLIDSKDLGGASKYLDNVFDYIDYSKEYAKSGNPEIDSIINYKLDLAEKYNIKSKVNLVIPDKLKIDSFDLSIILGNLLDNAMEAASKNEDNKFINISIELDRNVLYLSICNSYEGKLKFNGKKLVTSKDGSNHGLGLSSVERSIEKYNGTMSIRHSKKVFYVDILMYNQQLVN
ncbi:MAG: GHKL domain-containing protein [Tissierellia bacterium]|nr:GHKL domain-containing protein [Tissierellia bacterium]